MNLGIILPSLEMSQLAYETINTINQEIINGSPHSYVIFFEELSTVCVQPLCAVMNISEIWSFDGLLISTTLENTLASLKVTSNMRRAFLLWDCEWLRGRTNYLLNLSILRNPELLLIARSEDCAFELERYANRRPNLIMPQLAFGPLADQLNDQA